MSLRHEGHRHIAPLFDALADYGAVSDQLPFPSQERLAHDCGVTARTVRRWLAIAELLGLVVVYRSIPELRGRAVGLGARTATAWPTASALGPPLPLLSVVGSSLEDTNVL